MNLTEARELFYGRLKELYTLGGIEALLGWDQRVYMPPMGAESRADQIEYMELLMHKKATDPEYAAAVDMLFDAMDTLSDDDKVNVRESKRKLDIHRKLPDDFVSEMSQAASMGYTTWAEARPKNDFKAVQPYLEKLLELNKRQAELLGYKENPYDALLDLYEPGMLTSTLKPMLMGLAESLREIIPPIAEQFKDLPVLTGNFPESKQYELQRRVAKDMGFSFDSGRLDTTPHPFMTGIGPSDVRITTRYDLTDFLGALYSTIHETGHALYDLALPKERAGTPLGKSVSSGVHESQSRLWENIIGRSIEFSRYLSPIVMEIFPEDSQRFGPEDLWRYINRVQPSLIRTESDEATYSQHIVIRMILEEAMINGQLEVVDLPDAWNELYEKYLGVKPTDYKDGVMQDVHWHGGAIGYFPTYALGNLYNAMMIQGARRDIPNLSQQIEQGQFSSLYGWLKENIYNYGKRYKGTELVKRITGEELSAQPFVDYLKDKFLK